MFLLPYPHACKARNSHEGQDHSIWASSCQTEHSSDEDPVDVGLAKCAGEREASEEQHNGGREHHGEDVSVKSM